ncbi:MAG: hypothetical protein IH608_00725 [Proteobacteria bacterium]|nr:hypothetical protein [Pseudomonadota bacterium]
MRELALRSTVSGAIDSVGKVDWYHLRAVEANSVLQVRASSNTYRPDVDLLITVFEADAAGGRTRIYGTHARDGSPLPADLTLNVYIDRPKDLYVSVRDLLDDEASAQPYYLSADFISAADEDGSFATALPLGVDDPGGGLEGTIGYVGDVDCFTFQAASDGVYAVTVDFSPFHGDTGVTLAVRLYDGQGVPVAIHPGGSRTRYALRPYLVTGTYYVTVEDAGRDDFDLSSPYAISVATVPVDEARADDALALAAPLALDAGTGEYTAAGALEYAGDQDWFALPDASAAGIPVLDLRFDDLPPASDLRFAVTLADETGKVLLSREHVAGSAEYRTQLRAGQGVHFVQVTAVPGTLLESAAPYALAIRVVSVDDPGEDGTGNDTIDTAELLPAGGDWVVGKIAFRGDEDWYRVDTDSGAARVLEVFLETEAAGPVDYALSVIRDGVSQRVFDSYGGDGPTHLKASLLVPAASPAGPVSYSFRVCDVQGDEGDNDAPYRLRARVVDVPSTLPASPDPRFASAVYRAESEEATEPLGASALRVEMTSLVQRRFTAETSLLDPAGPHAVLDAASGLTTVTFPWIGGYVDYQGDQDWYELNLEPLDAADTAWYYDVQVELASPGSEVEYLWKLYRDVDQDRDLVDRPGDSDGFFGSGGDPDTVVAALDLVAPDPGEAFWVGVAPSDKYPWRGKFYLSLSDFHFLDAERPDDDWGYDAPYYFRVTLTYHPGAARP